MQERSLLLTVAPTASVSRWLQPFRLESVSYELTESTCERKKRANVLPSFMTMSGGSMLQNGCLASCTRRGRFR